MAGDLSTRFWSKVRRSESDSCWPWTAHVSKSGYGRMSLKGRLWFAHRLAWQLERGPIPPGLYVLHHCDNRPCCNPNHLFLGTLMDNYTDMVAKGRSRRAVGDSNGMRLHPERVARGERHGSRTRPDSVPRGEQNGRSKLTESDVRQIRDLVNAGFGQGWIGSAYGITKHMVVLIARRINWRHVA